MNTNYLDAAKLVSKLVVSTGVAAVVGNVVKSTTPADAKLHKKICILVGTAVISNLVTGIATKNVDSKIDDVAAAAKDATDHIKNAKKNKTA
jgi:hypothetical protein